MNVTPQLLSVGNAIVAVSELPAAAHEPAHCTPVAPASGVAVTVTVLSGLNESEQLVGVLELVIEQASDPEELEMLP